MNVNVTLNWSNEQEHLDIHAERIAVFERLLALAAEAEGVEEGEVSLTFVDDETIRELNKTYRGIDKATDVLSFPMEDPPLDGEDADEWDGGEEEEPEETDMDEQPVPHLLGDIVISVPTAQRQSEAYGHSIDRELGFLFVHGFLHLIGYDHETPEAERDMFARQEAILQQAGLKR
jgi:probable rRNA maturation factor